VQKQLCLHFFVEGQDSILDAALRAGFAVDYRCSNGNCGMCKGRILKGEVKKIRHHDFVIPEMEKSQGYVLLCCNTAVTDVLVEADEAENASEIPRQEVRARVKRLESVGTQDAILHLQTPRNQRLRFLAGQSARLSVRGEEADFPIASCPCDDRNLQFHLHRGESFADKAFELHPNDCVDLVAPHGNFVLDDDSPRSLLFVAFGGGFAPIKSLVERIVDYCRLLKTMERKFCR